jgi:hypothetical protein
LALRIQIAVDCHDVFRLADFWSAVLSYELMGTEAQWAEHSRSVATYPREAWARIVDPDGSGPAILFHSVPEPKAGKNRIHLDIRAPRELSDDRQTRLMLFIEKIEALGGTKLRVVQDEHDYFAVMQDPERNEFCVGAGD